MSTLDIASAKSVSLVSLIGRSVKLQKRGHAFWACCPFHTERTPSFKIENNRYYCFGCGAKGDAIDWMCLTENVPFTTAIERLRGGALPVAKQPLRSQADRDEVDRQKAIEARDLIWAPALSLANSKAQQYLLNRGLTVSDNQSLRFREALSFAPGMMLPCLVAAVAASDNNITAVQVTYLNRECTGKAQVATPRRSHGHLGDGAVRLAEADDVLGIAEGVETALSAMELTGVPTWACLSAARMHSVATPKAVKEIHLFADNDLAGINAAHRTAQIHSKTGRRVVIRKPPNGHNDWNDYMISKMVRAA